MSSGAHRLINSDAVIKNKSENELASDFINANEVVCKIHGIPTKDTKKNKVTKNSRE